MSFSATEAAFEGFRVVRRNPVAALFWGLAYLVMFLVMFGLGAGHWASFMTMAESLQSSGGGDPQSQLAAIGEAYTTLLAGVGWIIPLGLILGAVLSAAVARSVLRPDQSRLGYLRLGMDEVRVLAVSVIVSITLGLASGLALLIPTALAATGQAFLALLGLVLGLAAIGGVIWLTVRLSLAVPITVDRGKIAILESFKATKGRFWALLGMAILAFVMSMVVSILGGIISAAVNLAGGGIEGLARFNGLSSIEILAQAWLPILLWSVVNAFLSALQIAVLYAPFSAAWQSIRGLVAPAEHF